MDVDIVLLEELRIGSQLGRETTHVGEGGLGRFLHDIAQLPREHQAAGARHRASLDEEYVSTCGCPGQTSRNPRITRAALGLPEDLLLAQQFGHPLHADGQASMALLCHHAGELARDSAYLSFQGPYSGLARVALDE